MSYRIDRESLASSTALIQIDFSVNFGCVSQDEIQSAHWQQSQVSIFTAMIWYSGTSYSYVLVSDNMDHSKNTVIPYIDRLLEQLPNNIEEVTIWSDGPASQFKNRYIAEALKVLSEGHGKRITWKFFATSHGKGPVDGIGGAIKRRVWSRVKSRKCIVNNASDFVKALDSSSKVTTILMGEEDLYQRSKKLHLQTLFRNCKPFLSITKFHHLELNNGDVIGHTTSSVAQREGSRAVKPGMHFQVDDWVVVKYDNSYFPGNVTHIENGDYKVNVMIKDGKFWKWPQSKDEIFYAPDKLIRKLNPPSLVNSRGFFKFDCEL